jgi:hypothetical protein
MLLLPQPWCQSDHLTSSISHGNLQVRYPNGINVLGILDSKESNSWPSTSGIKLTSTAIEACTACLQGKQTRHPSSKPAQGASNTLDMVISTHSGPMTPQSLEGAKYYISFRDDATSWTDLEPIKNKIDTFGRVKMYYVFKSSHGGCRSAERLVHSRSVPLHPTSMTGGHSRSINGSTSPAMDQSGLEPSSLVEV